MTTALGTVLDVDGSLFLDGELFMDQDGPDGLQSIYFYNSGAPAGESINWDNTNERFELSGAIPTTLAIAADGTIVDRLEGGADKARFEAMIAKALGN